MECDIFLLKEWPVRKRISVPHRNISSSLRALKTFRVTWPCCSENSGVLRIAGGFKRYIKHKRFSGAVNFKAWNNNLLFS